MLIGPLEREQTSQAITTAHRTTVSLTAEDDFLIVLKTKCVWGEITFKELKQTFLI